MPSDCFFDYAMGTFAVAMTSNASTRHMGLRAGVAIRHSNAWKYFSACRGITCGFSSERAPQRGYQHGRFAPFCCLPILFSAMKGHHAFAVATLIYSIMPQRHHHRAYHRILKHRRNFIIWSQATAAKSLIERREFAHDRRRAADGRFISMTILT